MRITIKQLKQLIHESMEDMDPMELERKAKDLPKMSKKEDLFSLYSDMHKEMYNFRPRWLKLEDVTEDELAKMIERLEEDYQSTMEERKREAQEEEHFFKELEKDRDKEEKLKKELEDEFGYEDLENLPRKSGMRKRLEETIKNIVYEAVKEEEKKKPKGKQKKLDVAPPFGKLDKHDFKKLGAISKSKAESKDKKAKDEEK